MSKKLGVRPESPQPRYRCPFYGFGTMIMMDTKGNQCSLKDHAHAPCRMKMAGETPDWERCSYFSEQMMADAGQDTRVFPQEFWPKGQSTWGGLSLQQWYDYVMRDDTPRPAE